jgi:uncharacterized membrane protein (DUF106 family)
MTNKASAAIPVGRSPYRLPLFFESHFSGSLHIYCGVVARVYMSIISAGVDRELSRPHWRIIVFAAITSKTPCQVS